MPVDTDTVPCTVYRTFLSETRYDGYGFIEIEDYLT